MLGLFINRYLTLNIINFFLIVSKVTVTHKKDQKQSRLNKLKMKGAVELIRVWVRVKVRVKSKLIL
jgi:hypothetical protein